MFYGDIFVNCMRLFPGDVVDIGPTKFEDVNIIAGALKLYLRMLPLPVITFETYNKFIDAIRECLMLKTTFVFHTSIPKC